MTTLQSVILTSFVLAFLGTNAQVNDRCRKTPDLWKGHSDFVDYDTHYARYADVYYNRLTESVYLSARKIEDGNSILYEEWFNYKTNTKLNKTFNGECHSYKINRPFTPFGVNSSARFVGVRTLGGSLTVYVFSGEFSEGGQYSAYWAPLPGSNTTCIPVIETYIREAPGTPNEDRRNIHITYTDFSTDLVVPPTPCTPVNIRH